MVRLRAHKGGKRSWSHHSGEGLPAVALPGCRLKHGKGLPGWDAIAKLPGTKDQRSVDVPSQRRRSSDDVGRWRKGLICP